MRVEGLLGYGLDREPRTAAQQAVDAGLHGLWAGGGGPESLLRLALAAAEGHDLRLGTGIVLAFAHNPMTLAATASELHELSGGRFVLGLGSQMQAHIEGRYGVPFGPPVARMRDFISALRAIWEAGAAGSPVAYDGTYYRHHGPPPAVPRSAARTPFSRPSIGLAAVGPRMTELAGELADVVLLHGSTARFIDEVTAPALERGLSRAHRRRSACEVWNSCLLATGETAADVDRAAAAARRYVCHIAGTGAYRRVFAIHGWEQIHDRVVSLVTDGDLDGADAQITDDILEAFAVVAPVADAAAAIRSRFEGRVDSVGLCFPAPVALDVVATIADGITNPHASGGTGAD